MASFVPVWAVQLGYIALCLAGMFAVFDLQRNRHRNAPCLLWWTYNVLAGSMVWEAIDAFKYAPPGWPASRWFLIPSITVVLIYAVITDRRKRLAASEETK